MSADAERAFMGARTSLFLDGSIYGALSLRLKPRVDPTQATAWTDGESLGYNPEWFLSLSISERQSLIAHEVNHCMMGHAWRREGRDPTRWNEAADHVTNLQLQKENFRLPPNGCCDPQYEGLSVEAVYGRLPPPEPGGGSGGQGEGQAPEPGDDPNGWGAVRDAPEPEKAQELKTQWEQATVQALIQEQAKKGTLSADLARLLTRLRQPPCHNLLAALLEFAEHTAREDFTWKRPNPRYLAHGLYLPSLQSERVPPFVFVADTSGSISKEMLEEYAGGAQTILDTLRPESLLVIACDSRIKKIREYLPGDEISTSDFPGGGGTNFVPAFEHLEKEGIEPAALVYMTDLEGDFPDREPLFSTLWVVRDTHGRRPTAPWGRTIWLEG